MDGATLGLIGGIAGGRIGLAGGVIGTWNSLRRARSPAERKIVVLMAVALWLLTGVFVTVLVLVLRGVLPLWVDFAVMTAFFVALGPMIVLANRRIDAAHRAAEPPESRRRDDEPGDAPSA